MKRFISNMFTEPDNETFDIARVLAAMAVLTGLFLSIVGVIYKNVPINMQDYGIGIGALFAGLGIALGVKKDSDVNDISK